MARLELNKDRFFDPQPEVRKIASELYAQVKNSPIVSPHGHVEPRILAENTSFSDPTELIIIPDHYIYRLLYSQGVSMESLGIPTKDGTRVETDRGKIWQTFADYFYLFAGTPTGAWLSHEFSEVFGIKKKLDSKTAMEIYDDILEKLCTPEFLPRALFDRFNIEVLTTTDGAADSLAYHKKIQESGWDGKVIPCFRPDAVVNILDPAWQVEINALGKSAGIEIDSFKDYIQALESRREFFKSMGAVSTDQGVLSPFTNELSSNEIDLIFKRALSGTASENDAVLFTAHMLMEMARMSVEDGLVMQIHPGSFRNHNEMMFKRFGRDTGSDIPIQTEFTRNLHPLLKKFGNNPNFTLILFTLDESTYTRELAPLAGHYPCLKLGPPWWFNDSFEGMIRFRSMVTETAS
ncbi:MAG: glucuronate isomerase, partial [Desulfobacteraceae bacterium]|nr:glucuronate isomerase [Desulfobacteraceae bacterium]